MLDKKQFNKVACRFREQGKPDIEGTTYSYESRNVLHDITVLGGKKYYQKNMSGYHTTIDHITPIHCEIERHYCI